MSNNVEYYRAKYEDSLLGVAKSMRDCAEMAEALARAVGGDTPTFSNSKGKGKALTSHDEEETNPNGKRKRTKKDPNAPKRPASSFIIYQNEVRGKVKEAHPDLKISDLRHLISAQWAKLPEEQKNRYKALADEAKENYSQEKAAYDARSPEDIAAAKALAENTPAPKKSRSKVKSAAQVNSPEPERPAGVKKPVSKAKAAPVPFKATPSSSSDDSDEESDEEDEDEKEKMKQKPKVKGRAQEEDEEEEEESDESESESESDEEDPVPAKKQKTKHEKPESKKSRK